MQRSTIEADLPERDRPAVKRKLRAAWKLTDHAAALERLAALAGELAHSHPGAAASLREGLEETVTLQRLRVHQQLWRSLSSTNPRDHGRRGESVDQLEGTHVRKDGRLIDVALTISPIRNGAGRLVSRGALTITIRAAGRVRASRPRWSSPGPAVRPPVPAATPLPRSSRCSNACPDPR